MKPIDDFYGMLDIRTRQAVDDGESGRISPSRW